MKNRTCITFILMAALLAFNACKTPDAETDLQITAVPSDGSVWETAAAVSAAPTDEITPPINDEQALASYLVDKESLDEVCSIIADADLNADGFRTAVEKYLSAGMSQFLPSGWIPYEEMKTNYMDCADAWAASADEADGNCRLTALLILKNSLKYSNLRQEYDGTYMMFDVDAIQNSTIYSDADPLLLSSLFGEWTIIENDIATTYAKSWSDFGFEIGNPNVSLISIVFSDSYDNCAFVGHVGTLIRTDDSFVFIEKIAFEQPYVVTKAKSLEQIVDMLSARSDYQCTDEEQRPVIFENDRQIGKIG